MTLILLLPGVRPSDSMPLIPYLEWINSAQRKREQDEEESLILATYELINDR